MKVEAGDDGLSAATWASDDFDFWAFDRELDKLALLRVQPAIVEQVSIRAQRLDDATDLPWMRSVLAAHEALHDLTKPLVRADLDHARDTWRWTLRLGTPSPAEQLAALLHDVERLASEADARIEHRAPDYQAFKDAHARRGAELARELVPADLAGDVCRLIATHEHAPGIVADADALSWFSFNSPGYLRYFGVEQTRRKTEYSLARMSPGARAWLDRVRMPRAVRDHLAYLRTIAAQNSA